MNETSLRIQKLIRNNPEMTNAQIARKIGREGPYAEERVERERKGGSTHVGQTEWYTHLEPQEVEANEARIAAERASCLCGGLFDMCEKCIARRTRSDF